MKELAAEYRVEAARIAMELKRLQREAPEERERIAQLKKMLDQVRKTQWTMEHYYDGYRWGEITLKDFVAPRRRSDAESGDRPRDW